MHKNLNHLPPYIIQLFNIHEMVARYWYVYIKIKKVMYGLKQAALLSYSNSVKNLAPRGYFP